ADLDLAMRWTDGRFDLGPRVAIGFRRELWPSLALYVSGSARLGFLGGLRGALSATVGLVGLFTLNGKFSWQGRGLWHSVRTCRRQRTCTSSPASPRSFSASTVTAWTP